MPFRDVIGPEHLAILTTVLDDVCRAAGIPQSGPEREDVAWLVMHFYGRGFHSADELRAALDEAMRQERYG
jgi:hypothetical protein